MELDVSKLKNRFLWQTVILVIGSFVLLAELIILGVFLVGRFFGETDTAPENTSSSKPTRGQIVVPEISPVKANEFTAEDFIYAGDYLTCTARPSELGVDVSHYQGQIDWQQVKAAGFTFAIIRIGGRGYGEEGKLFADSYAQINYEGAKAAGLKVGAYFFSQAINELEAKEEAWYALELISGWELDLPLVYDWEYISDEARTGYLEESDKIAFTKAFFRVVEVMGVQPMAYVAPWASEEYMLAVQDYPVWVVQYSDQMTFPYQFDYWQYSCTGSVPGITGNVDINLYIPPEE